MFRVLLAGSHTLEEFKNRSAHLVNIQVLKIGCLEKGEAIQLIKKPVPQFQLTYHPSCIEKILALTRGHPQLIQQICFELVELKNDQPAGKQTLAEDEDIEQVVPRALKSASLFFLDIQNNQIQPQAARLLQTLARLGPGAVVNPDRWNKDDPDSFDEALSNLLQRDLVEAAPGGFRFQIELIRRWFSTADLDLTSDNSRAIIPL
jgi:hypothetical protein